MKEILKVQNFLTKNGFDVEHFEECEEYQEHLVIYDNNDTDLYKLIIDEESILLQSYCSEFEKFFYEKTKLKSFLIEDIKQYL